MEAGAWKEQADAGLSLIALDGTLYDHILDFAVTYLGLVPSRFAGLSGLDLYFAAARGVKGATALDMSKARTFTHRISQIHTPIQAFGHLCP